MRSASPWQNISQAQSRGLNSHLRLSAKLRERILAVRERTARALSKGVVAAQQDRFEQCRYLRCPLWLSASQLRRRSPFRAVSDVATRSSEPKVASILFRL